jgi:hypothetical protein
MLGICCTAPIPTEIHSSSPSEDSHHLLGNGFYEINKFGLGYESLFDPNGCLHGLYERLPHGDKGKGRAAKSGSYPYTIS